MLFHENLCIIPRPFYYVMLRIVPKSSYNSVNNTDLPSQRNKFLNAVFNIFQIKQNLIKNNFKQYV